MLAVSLNSAKFIHFLCGRQVRRAREWRREGGKLGSGNGPRFLSMYVTNMRSNRVPVYSSNHEFPPLDIPFLPHSLPFFPVIPSRPDASLISLLLPHVLVPSKHEEEREGRVSAPPHPFGIFTVD